MLFQERKQPLSTFAATLASVLLCLTPTLRAGNDKNYTYLALGDSVAFGLNPTLLTQPPPPPTVFTGYPETIAAAENLLNSKKEVNASCPGETSGSFINVNAPDYGCHSNGPQGQPPFKNWVGLHTDYSGSQLDFAVSQLASNKHIDLVTLGIGSNDVLLLLGACGAAPNPTLCVNNGLSGVLQTYAGNLGYILTALRANYKGAIVLVGFYSPSPALIPIAQALNATTLAVSAQFNTIYADGFSAFQLAAANFGGDVCSAGLLIKLGPSTCDIHPSPSGRDLLAATVMAATQGLHVH